MTPRTAPRSARQDPYRSSPRRVELGEREQLDGRAPRVLAAVHLYPPGHNAGAEVMLHTMLRDLVRRGWEAHVLATEYRGEPYDVDGVHVERAPADRDMARPFGWADVVVTHLDATRKAMSWCRWGRPLVHVVHNHRQLYFHKVRPELAQLVVWNSEWVRERNAAAWSEHPSIVVRPPVYSHDYATRHDTKRHRGRVTLLNLYPPKGSKTFWRLVAALPEQRFLGVRGSYGGQDVPRVIPSNACVIENTPNVVRDVYRHTRVLLVPSHYESWGRVAVEAMASGIPVIAHPTPGLQEALTSPELGGCALFVDAADTAGWIEALQQLDDPSIYDEWSKRSLARSAELDAIAAADLDAFADAMLRLAR